MIKLHTSAYWSDIDDLTIKHNVCREPVDFATLPRVIVPSRFVTIVQLEGLVKELRALGHTVHIELTDEYNS